MPSRRDENHPASAVIYVGERTESGVVVTRRMPHGSAALRLRLDLRNHSPTGFEWGYGGSGPAQLALALLADALDNDEHALRVYQAFKWKVVAGLPVEGWELTQAEVQRVAAGLMPPRPTVPTL